MKQDQPAGYYTLIWDGTDDAGDHVASGMYLLQFQAGHYSSQKKMTLIR